MNKGMNQRSDADIIRAVARALELSAFLPKNPLQVRVENGHVTLVGEVEWDYQRDTAAAVARWVTGVNGVSNDTVVKPRNLITRARSQIEAARRQPGSAVPAPVSSMSGPLR